MDARHFDSLTRSLRSAGTRRGLLGLLAALPLLAGPGNGDALDEVEARGKKRKRKRKPKPAPCESEPPSQTCAGKCGKVTNNCLVTVECGACPCTPISGCPANSCGPIDTGCGGTMQCPACPDCQMCSRGQCVSDHSKQHTCCSGNNSGKWCEAGACVAIPDNARASLSSCGGMCDCRVAGNSCAGGSGGLATICGVFRYCPLCDN